MYKMVLTKTAMQDIRSAALYISDTLMNKEAANRLLDAVDEKIGALAEMPYINPLFRDSFLDSNGLRFQLVNNYMAFMLFTKKRKPFLLFVFSIQDETGFRF